MDSSSKLKSASDDECQVPDSAEHEETLRSRTVNCNGEKSSSDEECGSDKDTSDDSATTDKSTSEVSATNNQSDMSRKEIDLLMRTKRVHEMLNNEKRELKKEALEVRRDPNRNNMNSKSAQSIVSTPVVVAPRNCPVTPVAAMPQNFSVPPPPLPAQQFSHPPPPLPPSAQQFSHPPPPLPPSAQQFSHPPPPLPPSAQQFSLPSRSPMIAMQQSTVPLVYQPAPSQLQIQLSIADLMRQEIWELRQQAEGLKELIAKLIWQDPNQQNRAYNFLQRNPKLSIVDYNDIDRMVMTLQQQHARNMYEVSLSLQEISIMNSIEAIGKQQLGHLFNSPTNSNQNRRTRNDSEWSTCSSQPMTPPPSTSSAAKQKGETPSEKNKRNRKRSKKNTSTQSSEQEAFVNYINNMLKEYLGEMHEKFDKLKLMPENLNDMEAYAQRLIAQKIGRIVETQIRVNKKNNHQSFVSLSTDRESKIRDGKIDIPIARKYAFDGDTVRAFVLYPGVAPDRKSKKNENGETADTSTATDSEEAIDSEIDLDATDQDTSVENGSDPSKNSPKAFVIDIVKQTALREVVGTISFNSTSTLNNNRKYYKLKPHDMRMPFVYIPEENCKSHITKKNKNYISGILYLAHVRETDRDGHCIGELVEPVGMVGNIESEIAAILIQNHLRDVKPLDERFNDMFSTAMEPITEEQLVNREDLRDLCIFTIDPLTARDLDDAISVELICKGEYEVGVHISDVSHYLLEDSELDNIVKERATSVYLVNEVIHMLPPSLCYKCSLLPGEDKFAFSVFWRITAGGEIISKPRFTRSVIRSCSQLAYENAQRIIDNKWSTFKEKDLPNIVNGFKPWDIKRRIITLNKMAMCLRKKRYENGALSINNTKIRFTLDPKTGEPIYYEQESHDEANFLIEEFMLLANQSVARFIYEHFPNNSILRRHEPPLATALQTVCEKLQKLSIKLECSSSKELYDSMQRLINAAPNPEAMDAFLNSYLTKPMARAKYFCSENKTLPSELSHYALSIPIYTHFTSPIRRYPDVLVHRLLAAALNYCPPPQRPIKELHEIAERCNDQKYNAKLANDDALFFYFKRYIKQQQFIVMEAVVVEICRSFLTVVIIKTGHSITMNYNVQKPQFEVDNSHAPAFIIVQHRNKRTWRVQPLKTLMVRLVVQNDKLRALFSLDEQPTEVQVKNAIPLQVKNAIPLQGKQNTQFHSSPCPAKKQQTKAVRNAANPPNSKKSGNVQTKITTTATKFSRDGKKDKGKGKDKYEKK